MQNTTRQNSPKSTIPFRVVRYGLALAILLGLIASTASQANNIEVSNVALADKSPEQDYWKIHFDLRWENSWRTDNLFSDDGFELGNWDAAWVFVKYRVDDQPWRHAVLASDGHSMGSGTSAQIEVGLADEGLDGDEPNNPAVGVLIYRSSNGSGTFETVDNRLRWKYDQEEIAAASLVDVKVYAIEMVYVAPGVFFAGSGGDEAGRFIAGGSDNEPFRVRSDWDGSIANTPGSLWGASTEADSSIGEPGSLDERYPTGAGGFYTMKYPVSQQQYVDFLNSLTYKQQDARIGGSPDDPAGSHAVGGERYRNEIRVKESGEPSEDPAGQIPAIYETGHPDVAMNHLSWMDAAAFAGWAGLRPMSELEFEKAGRGPAEPVAGAYAWGTDQAAGSEYSLSNAGQQTEGVASGFSGDGAAGNALYEATGGGIGGPVRVGIFAAHEDNDGRVSSGGSYWGIMDLSGNVADQVVSVANAGGRAFTGRQGAGHLTPAGYAPMSDWPGSVDSGEDGGKSVTGTEGAGQRGGSWEDAASRMRLSDRGAAAAGRSDRRADAGFRAARSLPAGFEPPQTVPVDPDLYSLSIDAQPSQGGSVSGAGEYEQGAEITITATASDGYSFDNWSGDTDYVADESADHTTVTMPDGDITLTANFEQEYDGDWPRDTQTEVVEVTNPETGRTWMDRNLGASRAATSSTDSQAYGDLYQWGRPADGHQRRNSSTTSNTSNSDQPGHGSFITLSRNPYDWRNPRNDDLWQGVDGINNPCPPGYRLPTDAEWNAERNSWSSNNAAGALGSPLILPMAGYRLGSSGSLFFVGSRGDYWSSTVSGSNARALFFGSSTANMGSGHRANGNSVRCLKDTSQSIVQPPQLSTLQLTKITLTTALSGGTITDDGGSEITEMGVVWATTDEPSLTNNDGITADSLIDGVFRSRITGLSPETTYYVRAYATNSAGTTYGDTYEFETLTMSDQKEAVDETVTRVLSEDVLSIAAEEFDSVPEEHQAEYLDSLDAALNRLTNELNEYYSEEEFREKFNSYLQSNSKILGKSIHGEESLLCNESLKIAVAKGLDVDVTASAAISSNLAYELSLMNGGGVETIYDFVNMDRNVYLFRMCGYDTHAFIGLEAGASVALDMKGFYRIINSVPINDSGNKNRFDGTIKGKRINLRQDLYGKLGLTFHFSLGSAQQISQYNFDNLSKCSEEIPDAVVNNRGMSEYSFDIGVGKGAGLKISTVIETEEFASTRKSIDFFYKDYSEGWGGRFMAAIRMAGDMIMPSYADALSGFANSENLGLSALAMLYGVFDPNDCQPPGYLPDVRTLEAGSLTQNSAVISATIVDDGDDSITERGICWSESSEPDSFTNCTNEGMGMGEFSSTIEDLESDTRYYARAFARNSIGTAYGDRISFTTMEAQLSPPTVTTSSVTNITHNSARSGGNVTSSGGASVTSRGVCYSTSQNPTTSSSCVTSGSGTGSFTVNLSGLSSNRTYYVRAYATNSEGTSYGSQRSFKTDQQTSGSWPRDTQTSVVEVTNPETGRTWMDRNLGASRAATSSTDSQAYGDLYQWGRPADGHQRRNSSTTSTLSSSDQPGHGNFITSSWDYNFDWRNPRNDDLWQGVDGINNPCPPGYRLPTDAEWNAERNSWSSNNAAGALGSPLKLPMAGNRSVSSGSLFNVGSHGDYWSSTVSGSYARILDFNSSLASMYGGIRAVGISVRCLEDD